MTPRQSEAIAAANSALPRPDYDNFGTGYDNRQPWLDGAVGPAVVSAAVSTEAAPVAASKPAFTAPPAASGSYDPDRIPLVPRPWEIAPTSRREEPAGPLKAAAADTAAQTSAPAKQLPGRPTATANSREIVLAGPMQVGKYAGIVLLRDRVNTRGHRHWYGLDEQGKRHHVSQDAILESFAGPAVRPQGRRPKSPAVMKLAAVEPQRLARQLALAEAELARVDELIAQAETDRQSSPVLLPKTAATLETAVAPGAASLAAPHRPAMIRPARSVDPAADPYAVSREFGERPFAMDPDSKAAKQSGWREAIGRRRTRLVSGLVAAAILVGAAVFAENNDSSDSRVAGRAQATAPVATPAQPRSSAPIALPAPSSRETVPSAAPTTGNRPAAPKPPASRPPAKPAPGAKHRAGGTARGNGGHIARHAGHRVQAVTIHKGGSVWQAMEATTIDGHRIPRSKLWAASWIEMKANHITKAHEVRAGSRLKIATARLAALLASQR